MRTAVEARRAGRAGVESRAAATSSPPAAPDGVRSEVHAVVVAYVQTGCQRSNGRERFARAIARHVACYDRAGSLPAHLDSLRPGFLATSDHGFLGHGSTLRRLLRLRRNSSDDGCTLCVLGWLLAGADALSSCNTDDRTLIALASIRCPMISTTKRVGGSSRASASLGGCGEAGNRAGILARRDLGPSAGAGRASGLVVGRRLLVRFDTERRLRSARIASDLLCGLCTRAGLASPNTP